MINSFGTTSTLKTTLIIKRYRKQIAFCGQYLTSTYIKDYEAYFLDNHQKNNIMPIEYEFSGYYPLFARGENERYTRRYGACKRYVIYGVRIESKI